MQFKNPEILYGLFLLVIPIIVHLFQLRRFKKQYFTNVQLLKQLSVQTRKSSKIKKWLLLATRLLLFTALIFAFAQPFFKAKDSKNSNNELYIILDNSFSMQAKGQKGELLKRTIEDLLEHTPENINFSLLTNNDNFWNTDIKSIKTSLQKLSYSPSSFELERLMGNLQAHKSVYNKDVIIITDAIGLKQQQLKSIDKNLNTYFIVPKAEQKNNISVDSVYINQIFEKFYEIEIKLSGYGDDLPETPISLFNNKKLIAKTLIKFDNKKKIQKFTIPKQDFNGYVSISDNTLDYDNNLYFSISKPQKTNVLSIGADIKSNFLTKIYNPEEYNYNNFELSSLNYNIIEKQDAIILNEINNIPQALQTTLKSFVTKGGNLIFIPSNENKIMNINELMNNFGKIQFNDIQKVEKLITKISFNHPLYSSVFEKKTDNFQYPNTKSSFPITSSNPNILSYEDQSVFLTSLKQQLSSVYVFTAPLNKENSNFQNSPLIVPTFLNMAQSTQKTGISAITIGSNTPLVIDAQLYKDEIIKVQNDTENFIPEQQLLSNKIKLNFNDNPRLAGNFGIFKQKELLKNISFNYSRTEGDLSENNENLLSDYKITNSLENVFDTLQTNRTDSQVWKWFVILALLFLVTEIFIQKFVK